MNMRYLVTVVLFIASLTGAKAKNNISVDYTEESELVSVIAHLAKVPGYIWPEEQAGVIDYFHQVDSTFAPYANHPIMAFVTDSLVKQGFGYHVPVAMALRLKLKNGKLHYNTDLEADFNHYYRGITPQHEKNSSPYLRTSIRKPIFIPFSRRICPSTMLVNKPCNSSWSTRLTWIGTSRSLALSTMSLSISISVC